MFDPVNLFQVPMEQHHDENKKLNIHAWMPVTNLISSLKLIYFFIALIVPFVRSTPNTRMSFNFPKLCKNDNSHCPLVEQGKSLKEHYATPA